MQSTNGTHSDLADTLIGLTVGFLFCVLCMCALGWWISDEQPLDDVDAAMEALP